MKTFGVLLLIGGGLLLLFGFSMDTTVSSGFGGRVHNIGLMSDKQNMLLLGAALAVVGAVLFGFGTRMVTASQADADTRQCPYCAETIKKQAVLCRFCNREVNAADAAEEAKPHPATHDELMAEYGISHDGEAYQFGQNRYQRLEDAVAYAKLQRERA